MSWQYFESGYERTTDKSLIRILLEDLRDKAYWVQFVAVDFRSGPTILLEIEKNRLVFDLPRPWNPRLKVARAVYRDADKILYTFRTEILKTDTKKKLILTKFPKEYFRLERRRFYRVSTAEGSEAVFEYRKNKICADVVNISGGGAAVVLPKGVTLEVGDYLENLKLKLMVSVSKPFDQEITISKARVVREMPYGKGRKLYGLEFIIDKEREREPILRYTIKRELELRKAGL